MIVHVADDRGRTIGEAAQPEPRIPIESARPGSVRMPRRSAFSPFRPDRRLAPDARGPRLPRHGMFEKYLRRAPSARSSRRNRLNLPREAVALRLLRGNSDDEGKDAPQKGDKYVEI